MPHPYFLLHLMVPNADGPTVSDGGPVVDFGELGARRLGKGGRFAIACDPALVMDGEYHRGTATARAVDCDECKKTDAFKAVFVDQMPRSEQIELGLVPQQKKG